MFSFLSRKSVLRTALLFTLLSVFLGGSPFFLEADSPTEAKVIFTSGDVKTVQGSSPADEPVITGKDSNAEIVLPDKTVIRLAPDTQLTLGRNSKDIKLEQGAFLLQVPQGAVATKITTGNVSFEMSGATTMVDFTPSNYTKFIVLDGEAKAFINNRFGEWLVMVSGKMLLLPPGSRNLPEPVDVNLQQLVQTSTLVNLRGDDRKGPDASPLNISSINDAASDQQKTLLSGNLIKTNLVMLSGSQLLIASDTLLQTLENRTYERWFETRTSDPLTVNQGSPFTLDSTNTISTAGTITKNGTLAGTGAIYQNYQGDADQGGFANYVFGAQENAFERDTIGFNNRFSSRSTISTFLFSDLAVQGAFSVSKPAGMSDTLTLASLKGIVVSQPVTISSLLNNLSLIASNGSININKSITASIAPKSSAELAMETQSKGQYVGVDNWQAHDPLPAGTVVVNSTGSAYGSLTSAASEYLAPDTTRDAAKTGGVVDARTYNYAVQVGPYRNMTNNPPQTPFQYSKYVARYEVTRPLPIAYSAVENNPQFGSGLTSGQPTDQYRTLFNRSDLVRLGYLKIITYDANDVSSLDAEIKPFSDYATTYISNSELENKVKEVWQTEMAKKSTEKQAEAQRLIDEAKAVQDMTTNRNPSTGDGTASSTTTRSYQEFFAYARGAGSDLNIAANQSVSGFGRVTMAAEGNININGEVAGAENFYGIGSNNIKVADGGLIEVFTDNRLTGGGTIELSAQNKIEIAGRVQASATPQNYFNQWQKAGGITLNSLNADPNSIAIDITSTGQILALINSASYTKSDAGRSKVELASAGGKIQIDGLTIAGENYGKNIVADYGDLNIVNNGIKGVIDILGGAGLQADILKIGALGTEGVLNIYAGSKMDANTQIKLFGGQLSGGAVIFGGSGTVNLTSPAVLISADKVQVNTGVLVNTSTVAADVYANKNYWNTAQGGNPGASLQYNGTWSTTPNKKGPPLTPAGNF